MKRVVLIVLGVLLILFAIPPLVGGSVLAAWSAGDDPTIDGRIGSVASEGVAVVSEDVQVDWDWPFADRWNVTVGVEHPSSDVPVFIGYGPTDAVDEYLAGAPLTIVATLGTGEVAVRDLDVPGTAAPAPPTDQDFWVEQAAGVGRQVIPFAPETGDYRFVAMNADASQGVVLAVYGSAQLPFLFPIGIGLIVFGVLLAVVGIILLVLGIRSPSKNPHRGPGHPGYPPVPPGEPYAAAPGPYPGSGGQPPTAAPAGTGQYAANPYAAAPGPAQPNPQQPPATPQAAPPPGTQPVPPPEPPAEPPAQQDRPPQGPAT